MVAFCDMKENNTILNVRAGLRLIPELFPPGVNGLLSSSFIAFFCQFRLGAALGVSSVYCLVYHT